MNVLIIKNDTCKYSYQVVWKFLDHWFVLDTSSPRITHKAEVKIECISSIFLVVYSNGKSKNFRSKQSPTNEITIYLSVQNIKVGCNMSDLFMYVFPEIKSRFM
jgi:hypothetical protein